MLESSRVSATIDASAVPVLPGALGLAMAGAVAGGTRRNHAFARPHTDWGDLTEPEQVVLADAQTSGGLLVASTDGDGLARSFERRGVSFAEIGVVSHGEPGRIAVSGRLRAAGGIATRW
jgi:selenophosphate synthase